MISDDSDDLSHSNGTKPVENEGKKDDDEEEGEEMPAESIVEARLAFLSREFPGEYFIQVILKSLSLLH